MKATITSTDRIVEIRDPNNNRVMARVWEGVTEAGVPFVAYISLVQVHQGEDQAEFQRALQENKPPSADTVRAIDLRFII